MFRLPIAACMLLGLLSTSAKAEAPRVLAAGKLPNDIRLLPPKDLNGYFPFTPPKSKAEWEQRADYVRRQILVSQGAWPLPEKTPLSAVVYGKIDQGDYTVEKVYFEAMPGFFVCGNLYRPKNKSGKMPAVLSPHGHWANGRFHDAGEAAVRGSIVIGGERFENGGRSPLQARQVQLARMGCIAFHYDMIGYADSQQLSYELGHRFAKQRPEMNTLENWGFYSTQAETHLQSIMGLQTLSSIRALDFLCSLPEVDQDRLAISGASGGGTQTFLLAAVDPRIDLAFPAVMVSTAMQGGCTCENASLLRVETGNIEFAALFAPKPLGVTAANDWTKEMLTKGFPELKAHYAMMGAPNNVMLANLIHFHHNYNYVSRSAFYAWVNKHFKLGLREPVIEEDYPRLTEAELTVWNTDHPRPPSGDDFERKLCKTWQADTDKQLAALKPKDEASLKKWREVVGGGVEVVIGRSLPAAADVEYEQFEKLDRGEYLQMSGLLRNKPRSEELPIVFLYPKKWNGQAVIWAHADGKNGLFAENGQPNANVQKLLDAGASVCGLDLLFQGEFLADAKPVEQTRRVKETREFAGYTFGYNHALFAQRVHDILTAITFVQNHERKPTTLDVVGLGEAGPWVAAARTQAGDAVTRAVVDTAGFRFGKLTEIHDPNFLPGGAKYGDLPGMLALCAPGKLWLAGETFQGASAVLDAYKAAGAADKLTLATAQPADVPAAAVKYLLAP